MDPTSLNYSSYQSEIQQDANDAEVKTENIRCKICQQIHCDVRIVGCGCLIHTVSNRANIHYLNDRILVFFFAVFHDQGTRHDRNSFLLVVSEFVSRIVDGFYAVAFLVASFISARSLTTGHRHGESFSPWLIAS